jgi:hypothetical protein
MRFFNKLFGKPPSRMEYVRALLRVFADRGIQPVHYQEDKFSLKIGGSGVVFLENGYAEYCAASGSDRNKVLANLVSGVTPAEGIPESFESAKSNLIVLVRSQTFFPLAELETKVISANAPSYQGVTEAVTDELVMGMGYDLPHCFHLVNAKSFCEWGVERAEALRIAGDNLRERTDPKLLVEESPGVYAGRWGDSHESSRMVLTDFFHRLPLHGDPVVSIPTRNELRVTGSENVNGLWSMIERAEKTHFGPHPLSPHLFRLEDRRWVRFVPELTDLREKLAGIERMRHAVDCKAQKQSLDALHQKEGTEVFVATCMLNNGAAGKPPFSISVWSKGVDSLLPVTDEIMILIPETKEHVRVSWRVGQAVVGHRMEAVQGLLPKRFRVRTFPAPEEIEVLRREGRAPA